MDEETRRALRWEEIWSQFSPRTPMGRRKKRSFIPFMPGEEAQWQAHLATQEQLLKAKQTLPEAVPHLEHHLSRLSDPTDAIGRLQQGATLTVSDWFQVKTFLWHGWKLCSLIVEIAPRFPLSYGVKAWESVLRRLNPDPVLTPSFSLAASFDSRLQKWQQILEEAEHQVREKKEQAAGDVEQVFPLQRNREGEWVVDRQAPHLAALLADPRLETVRKTPFEVVFRPAPTPEVKEACRRRSEAADRLEAVEEEVLRHLADRFRPQTRFLSGAVEEVARFDLYWAQMRMAERWNGTRPGPDRRAFRIRGGVHPLTARSLEEKGRSFTAVDIEVRQGVTGIIGPNMGGKTVALTTVGLIASLGQYGFLVPARTCSMPLVNWITGVIGDGQDVQAGLSTFGAEVKRIAEVLQRPSAGLLLIDEPGRGTHPLEGAALSASLTSYLAERRNWSLQVTHFSEVLEVSGIQVYRVAGLSDLPAETAEGDWERMLEERMDYRLLPWSGESIPRDALSIAGMLGIPPAILKEARKRLSRSAEKTEHKGVGG